MLARLSQSQWLGSTRCPQKGLSHYQKAVPSAGLERVAHVRMIAISHGFLVHKATRADPVLDSVSLSKSKQQALPPRIVISRTTHSAFWWMIIGDLLVDLGDNHKKYRVRNQKTPGPFILALSHVDLPNRALIIRRRIDEGRTGDRQV